MKWGSLIMVLAICSPMHASGQPTFDPRDGVVFPANKVRELLRQCSRDTPQHVTGTWLPSKAQIRDLETGLPATFVPALKRQRNNYKCATTPLPTYGREYGGIVVGGRKLIYINAFPNRMIDFDGYDLAQDWKHGDGWLRTAVVVCDGGHGFWGAVYDPERKTFSEFAFNGAL